MTALLSLHPPFISEFDRPEYGERGTDPLATQATYERLADRILPFFTVRMRRPRFLTAIAVAARVCEPFGDDLAADGVSPAWLVFEWHVVEAFVRTSGRLFGEGPSRIPGLQKVTKARSDGEPVSAATYLMTPKTFGYSGVYRALSVGLQIVIDDSTLGEGGVDLLRVWEQEQGLDGFLSGRQGTPGASFLRHVQRAVEQAMVAGHVTRTGGWQHWESLANHLFPADIGHEESEWLWSRLLRTDLEQNPHDPDACTMRREFLLRLKRYGRAVTSRADETEYFDHIINSVSDGLRERLEMIAAYEGLCRCIEDTFRLALQLSAEGGDAPVTEEDFSEDPLAEQLAASLPSSLRTAREHFMGTPWQDGIASIVERYANIDSPEGLFHAVLEHHEEVQRSKPPNGRRPWFERVPGIIVRPTYRRQARGIGTDTYVHWYRTGTASEFLVDLGRIKP